MTAGGPRRGYALPVVLAVVAVLALVFASAATAVAAMAASARSAVDGATFRAAALSAEAEALTLAATAPFAADGLQVGAPPAVAGAPQPRSRLRLDGRFYGWRGDPAVRVGLQDEAGLLNLDASRSDTLMRLFARLRLSAVEAETLRDRLLDALDGDDERRPRGAEAPDYAAAGLPPPRPGGFDGLAEAAGVLGWPALVRGERARAVAALADAAPGTTAFNVNTAPVPVLALVLNISDEAARRITARREAGAITSLAQLGLPAAAAGGEPVRPNGRVRVTVEDVRRGLRYTSRLSPSDAAGGPPWRASAADVTRFDPPAPPPMPPSFLTRPVLRLGPDGVVDAPGPREPALGPATVLLARGLCRFERFRSPPGLSRRAALAAARVHARTRAPFASAGHALAKAGVGHGVWWWGRRAGEEFLARAGIDEPVRLRPEAAGQAAEADGWRVLRAADGHEAQHWSGGSLEESAWRRAPYDPPAWSAFARLAAADAATAPTSRRRRGRPSSPPPRPTARASFARPTCAPPCPWRSRPPWCSAWGRAPSSWDRVSPRRGATLRSEPRSRRAKRPPSAAAALNSPPVRAGSRHWPA